MTRPVGLQGITQSVRIADIRTRLEEGNRPSKGEAKELFAELDATRAKLAEAQAERDEACANLCAQSEETMRALKLLAAAQATIKALTDELSGLEWLPMNGEDGASERPVCGREKFKHYKGCSLAAALASRPSDAPTTENKP